MAKQYVQPEIDIVEVDANDGNKYSLPYGIAKGLGLDTTGMRPREVWDMLKGRGITPENEYDKLKEKAQQELPKEKVEVKEVISRKEDLEKWGAENNVNVKGFFENAPSEEVAVEQASKYVELYKQFPINKNKGETAFSFETLGGSTAGRCSYNYREDSIKIALNKSGTGDVKAAEEQIKMGFWSQASEENYKYQTLVHEYGHAIEYNVCSMLGVDEEIDKEVGALLQKAYADYRVASQFKKKSKELITSIRKKNFYDKIFPEIFKEAKSIDANIAIPNRITKDGYKTAPRISGYGATSWAEYFAESFANGLCGKPTAIGTATVSVVRRIYKGDFKW